MPALTYQEIQHILPLRYPFLMLDKVMYVNENQIEATKLISTRDRYTQNAQTTYNDFPIMLLIDACAQAGGILVHFRNQNNGNQNKGYLVQISDFNFEQQVSIGDTVTITCLYETTFKGFTKIHSQLSVAERQIANGKLTFYSS